MKKPMEICVFLICLFLIAACASDNATVAVKQKARNAEDRALEAYHRGDMEGAIFLFEQALEQDQSVNNLPGIASDLHNLARCYVNLGHDDNARKVLNEALEINNTIEDKSGIADNYTLLATIHMHHSEYEEALALLDKSYSLYEEDKNRTGMATVLNNMGSIYRKQELYDQSFLPLMMQSACTRKRKTMEGLPLPITTWAICTN